MGTDENRKALKVLTAGESQRHPLVIGFVGAIGISWEPIIQAFNESFLRFRYITKVIKLSKLVDTLGFGGWSQLPNRRSVDYYQQRMDACDEFRARVGLGSALAALAIAKIHEHRKSSSTSSASVYLLKSLKHPQEVKLLRHVYGEAFLLVGVASSAEERRNSLIESLSTSVGLSDNPRADTERLIARDESDTMNRDFGQNVRDTYSMSDVFIPAVAGSSSTIEDIDRFIEAVFASPFLTPRQHEEGMNFAMNASMRSSAAGRQVGAALIPRIGTPVVAGVNEVPKPRGGQYWEGDEPDCRDFRLGKDPNPIYLRRVMEEILDRLARSDWLNDDLREFSGSELFIRASKTGILAGARVSSLIEFIRCLHAEQAAIVNAARAGVSTQQAVLYTTTFPCHECAKFIIGAGIREVYYIEPYPKSLVDRLYGEMINTSPSARLPGFGERYRIPFYQYIGVSPRRYASFFVAGSRKIGERLVPFDTQRASPRIGLWNGIGVLEREASTREAIERIVEVLLAAESKGRSGGDDSRHIKDDQMLGHSEEAVGGKDPLGTIPKPDTDPREANGM